MPDEVDLLAEICDDPDDLESDYGRGFAAGVAETSTDVSKGGAKLSSNSERPVITVDPRIEFGQPCLHRVPVYAPAAMLAAGEPGAVVCDEYDLTREELLLCCWYEAMYGMPSRRRAWREWLARHAEAFHQGRYDEIPLPTE